MKKKFIATITLVIALLPILVGCASLETVSPVGHAILGEWMLYDSDSISLITFRENGSGLRGSQSFTWEIRSNEDRSELRLRVDNNTRIYTLELEEGRFNMRRSNEDTVYIRIPTFALGEVITIDAIGAEITIDSLRLSHTITAGRYTIFPPNRARGFGYVRATVTNLQDTDAVLFTQGATTPTVSLRYNNERGVQQSSNATRITQHSRDALGMNIPANSTENVRFIFDIPNVLRENGEHITLRIRYGDFIAEVPLGNPNAEVSQDAPQEEETTREHDLYILFIGNSFIFFDDLPVMFANVAESGGFSVYQSSSTQGGYTLLDHANPASPVGRETIRLITESHPTWDVVVMQEQSLRPFLEFDYFYEGVSALNELIREVEAEPALFMTWGRIDGIGELDFATNNLLVALAYFEVATETDSILFPVGLVWEAIVNDYPEFAVNLWHPDGFHASYKGSYLASIVFYTVLFEESPVGLWHSDNISAEDATFLQNFVANMFELD